MFGRVVFRGNRRLYSTQGNGPIISSTLLLSRNPVITADVPKFEAQYYKYQNELWRRLMWTFPSWYYFKKGTLAELGFRELNKQPVYNNPAIEFPKGRPVLVHNRDRRFKQVLKLPKSYAEAKEAEEGEAIEESDNSSNMSRQIVPNSRITEADKANDLTSLERKLSRTLYLVIKPENQDSWVFPNFEQKQGELKALHIMAEEGLYKSGGENINYFNVSNTPCHVYQHENNKREYFIKSHILTGKYEPQQGGQFMWLTKEELGEYLDKEYYQDIKHLFANV